MTILPAAEGLTSTLLAGILAHVLPFLPTLSGAAGAWILLGLKVLAAMGFVAVADVVMLYAC